MRVTSDVLSKAPNIYEGREQIKKMLSPICGMGKASRVALGFSDGQWTFKCVGSIVGSKGKFFRVVDKNLENVKQKILNQINGNGKK